MPISISKSQNRDMNSKPRVAVVTGANRGIGFEVCRQLAGRGIHVIASRSPGEATLRDGSAFALYASSGRYAKSGKPPNQPLRFAAQVKREPLGGTDR
jgi:NAD(P)-dependent dehydrogenase (short-subunit alcohol dehydrogenase family)